MKRASDVPPVVDSFGLAAGYFGNGVRYQFGERPRLGDEHAGVRRLPSEFEVDLAAGGLRRALFDQLFQRIERVVVVEADVEARPRFAGNEIDGLVADIDRREFQMRRRKLRAALVERLALQRGDQRHESADRIVGALRIGDVALLAGDDQMPLSEPRRPILMVSPSVS